MRTTLELDDDLLTEVRLLARQQGVTLGHLISELARQSLLAKSAPRVRNGIPLLVPKAGVPRPGLRVVNELRDHE
jgi:hypothetical protein